MNIDVSKVTKVRMIIFQPRLPVVPDCPEWSCDLKTLEQFAGEMREAVRECELAELTADIPATAQHSQAWEARFLHPSEKGCQWCKAKAHCPALAKQCLLPVVAPATYEGLLEVSDELEQDLAVEIREAVANVRKLDFKTIAKVYANLDLLKDWIKAVESRMLNDMLQGEKHRDWKLIRGRSGNRKWKDPEAAEARLKAMRLKSKDMYDVTVISPTAAEKLLKKRPKLIAAIQPYISRGEGAVQVAPMSSKGQSIDPYNEDLARFEDFSMQKFMELEDLI